MRPPTPIVPIEIALVTKATKSAAQRTVVLVNNDITPVVNPSRQFRSSHQFVLKNPQEQSRVAIEIVNALNEAFTIKSDALATEKKALFTRLQNLLPLANLFLGQNNLKVRTDDNQILTMDPPNAGLVVFFSLRKARMENNLLPILKIKTGSPISPDEDYLDCIVYSLTLPKLFQLLQPGATSYKPNPDSDAATLNKKQKVRYAREAILEELITRINARRYSMPDLSWLSPDSPFFHRLMLLFSKTTPVSLVPQPTPPPTRPPKIRFPLAAEQTAALALAQLGDDTRQPTASDALPTPLVANSFLGKRRRRGEEKSESGSSAQSNPQTELSSDPDSDSGLEEQTTSSLSS